MKYIWENPNWPKLIWRSEPLLSLVGKARLSQGKLLSRVAALGIELNLTARADILIEETVKTSAIEGELLNRDSVRSSVARHLGLPSENLPLPSRYVDGLVEVLLDATENFNKPLTATRLKSWQAALFPTGHSGLLHIHVGKWRGPGPMQVISGGMGKEKIHYEAPPSDRVEKEMRQFLSWWKSSLGKEEGLLRSGLAHFYFLTIHPFDDGNGRIARVLTDMALAQDERISTRYYSLSSQIMEERSAYYDVLEACQKGDGDVTTWLQWFLGCYMRAVDRSGQILEDVLTKAEFWHRHHELHVNERQRKVINRLLDIGKGRFEGGLTTRKYVSIAKVSRATAFREISDLLTKGILHENPFKGRSTSYDLVWGETVP